ncbi:uncharacterized protein LOC126880029 [Diabrotica virgifera virgifera]|uniref:Protein quiver n=1 Tax=Diabrotica virgifera virgifera TaxID=50390 RepID=A0ABM5JNK6_DIAVI|nr:uncharacterized protein LOC126880029 [Diabrotica virgifera virgifera]
MSIIFFIILIIVCVNQGYAQFKCYSCLGGPETRCGTGDLPKTIWCSTQCFESYTIYQNGALPLVERKCWVPPENNKYKTYCSWFINSNIPSNANAELISCRTCKNDKCNGSNNLVPRNNFFSKNIRNLLNLKISDKL